MPRKNKTLRHAVPARIKLMPLSEDNCWNMFQFRHYRKMTHYVNCVIQTDEGYEIGYFENSHLDIPIIKVYFSDDIWRSYTKTENIKRNKILLCYFELNDGSIKRFWDVNALRNCKELIGTRKLTYFDAVKRQGMDFTYEQPFMQYYHQPILRNRKLDTRRKYADVLKLDLIVDELDNELFVAIQKMAIEKFGVINSIMHKGKKVPCEIVKEIPVKLYDAKLNFTNRISFQIEKSYLRKTPFIKMKAGDYHTEFLSNLHMKTIYETVETVEEAEKHLKEFVSFSRIVPKLRTPWSYH
jgi:hypothetical protein